MTALTQEMKSEELSKMSDDGFRYELVRGELRKMAPAGDEHGQIAATLTGFLFMHVRANKLGVVYAAETGFKLTTDPDTVRAPDVAFVRQERVDAVGRVGGYWPGAPDLVVEVISPTDQYGEVEEKVADWLEAGTRMVIVINPRRRTARVHRSVNDTRQFGEGEILEGGEVVPGWKLSLDELFA